MLSLKKALTSSVGKKFIMGLSGLLLVGFVVQHLIANLFLLLPEGDVYNGYVYDLHSWGWLLYAAEVGLLGLFGVHIVTAILVTKNNKKARPQRYAAGLKSKGGQPRSTLSSKTMAITGLILLAFLVIHVWHFRFGPGIEAGYVTYVNGNEARDLYGLVVDTFQDPWWVLGYVVVMTFLGFHVRHGFWSMFQSLGAAVPRYSDGIHALGIVVAVALAAGFLGIPVWIFFGLGGLFL